MTGYTFCVPGPVVPKGRPRLGAGGRVYTPKATAQYEHRLAIVALAAGVRRLEGPLSVTLAFFFVDRRKKDLDNCIKTILDGLNGVAWVDDTQVRKITATKTLGHPTAYTDICIEKG